MRSARLLLTGLLVMGLSSVPAVGQPAQPPDQPAPAGAGGDAARLEPVIQMMRQSDEPSAAVEAYAKGQAIDRDSVALKSAYLAKMVEFGLPEMANAQSQDLIQRDPNNGLAWAVAAYMSAKRDETATALADITIAARQLPDDPFVLRTAAQLLAWVDTRADQSTIPQDVRASAEAMRKQIAARPAFAEAYGKAVEVYKQQAQQDDETGQAEPATRPSAATERQVVPEEQLPPPGVTYQPAPSSGYYDDYSGGVVYGGGYTTYVPYAYAPYTAYTDPFGYVPYPSYYPWWPNTFSGFSWWPTFSSVIIVDRNKHFSRHPRFRFDNDFVGKHSNRFHHADRNHRDKHRGARKDDAVAARRHGDNVVRSARNRDDWVRRGDRDNNPMVRSARNRDGWVRRGDRDNNPMVRPARDRDRSVVAQRDPVRANQSNQAAAVRRERDRDNNVAAQRAAGNTAARAQANNRAADQVANQNRNRVGSNRSDRDPVAARSQAADRDRNAAPARAPTAQRNVSPQAASPRRGVTPATPRAVDPPRRQVAPAPQQRANVAPNRGSASPQLRSAPRSSPQASAPRSISPGRSSVAPGRSSASPGRSAARAPSGGSSPRMSAPSRGGSMAAPSRGGGGGGARGGGGGGGGGGRGGGGGGGGRGR